MTNVESAWQPAVSAGRIPSQPKVQPLRLWTLAGRRWPLGLALFAGLFVLALLFVFLQVMLSAVRQGESRNRAVAERADAVWRCNALRSISQRASCRVQLEADALVTVK